MVKSGLKTNHKSYPCAASSINADANNETTPQEELNLLEDCVGIPETSQVRLIQSLADL